jgi:hypothetical protein
MIYEEIDLFSNQKLIHGLDKIVETIGYDTSKVERMLYRSTSLEHARERVLEETLRILQENGSRDVATEDCNLYKFNNISFDWLGAVLAPSLPSIETKALGVSGRIWYPAGGYMGWHTNNDNRGHKLYCAHSREGNKSFFRYQDPETKEIITSWDKRGWNFRIFKVAEELLWHCVYSETDRISIGYTLL